MAAAMQQVLADFDGRRERAGSVLERGEHEVAERMVARELETVAERARERIVLVARECNQAFPDVARRRDMGFLT